MLESRTFNLKAFLPSCTSHTGQDQSFLIIRIIDGIWRFKALTNPVTLLKRVDEHELNSDAIAVSVLQSAENLAQRQELFFASDEGCTRELEHSVHVMFLCEIIPKEIGLNFTLRKRENIFHSNDGWLDIRLNLKFGANDSGNLPWKVSLWMKRLANSKHG